MEALGSAVEFGCMGFYIGGHGGAEALALDAIQEIALDALARPVQVAGRNEGQILALLPYIAEDPCEEAQHPPVLLEIRDRDEPVSDRTEETRVEGVASGEIGFVFGLNGFGRDELRAFLVDAEIEASVGGRRGVGLAVIHALEEAPGDDLGTLAADRVELRRDSVEDLVEGVRSPAPAVDGLA